MTSGDKKYTDREIADLLEKAQAVEAFFKDAFCAKEVDILTEPQDFEIQGGVIKITPKKGDIFYLAPVLPK